VFCLVFGSAELVVEVGEAHEFSELGVFDDGVSDGVYTFHKWTWNSVG